MALSTNSLELKRLSALIQILNTPHESEEGYRRLLKLEGGIGDGTVDDVISESERRDLSIIQCLKNADMLPSISGNRAETLKDFGEKVTRSIQHKESSNFEESVRGALRRLQFFEKAVREKNEDDFNSYLDRAIRFTVEHGESDLGFFSHELQHGSELYLEKEEGYAPNASFNARVVEWLKGTRSVKEHETPAAFEVLRRRYEDSLSAYMRDADVENVHRSLLSSASDLMDGVD